MKNTISVLSLILILLFLACSTENNEQNDVTEQSNDNITEERSNLELEEEVTFNDKVQLPNGYSILDEISGDLNNDGKEEKVVVCNTDRSNDFGIEREIRIFKKGERKWELWVNSASAILKSEEGGMMGDPYRQVVIEDGILIIDHFGGSSWKWEKTDKYHLEDGVFELIGYTSNYGKPCEYWSEFDFNLSTGDIDYSLEPEKCKDYDGGYTKEQESFINKEIKLNLENRYAKPIVITSPVNNYELHL